MDGVFLPFSKVPNHLITLLYELYEPLFLYGEMSPAEKGFKLQNTPHHLKIRKNEKQKQKAYPKSVTALYSGLYTRQIVIKTFKMKTEQNHCSVQRSVA